MNVSIPNGSFVVVLGAGEPQAFLVAQPLRDLNDRAIDASLKKLDKLDANAVQLVQGPVRLIGGRR